MKMCKMLPVLLQCACLPFIFSTAIAANVIFDDDFTGSSVSAAHWHIPTWVSPTDGTYVGRTQFRCTQNSGLPSCINSNAIIVVETYNPTGFSFYGTDLISNVAFAPPTTGELVVTARLKTNQIQAGTVFAFFLYAAPTTGTNHDEIDFELVGNLPNQFNTNIYGNEPLGVGHPQSIPYTFGTIADYHVYEIHWNANRVTWVVDGTQVRQVTTQSPIPVGPMYIHLNAWVPDETWSEAYSATITPASSAAADQVWSMSVDSVIVYLDGAQGCGYTLAGDLNGDCMVDFVDYAMMGKYWLNTNCAASNNCNGTDFDSSGTVNLADLKAFCNYWLQGL